VLEASLGVLGTVRKRRQLFIVGNTRIHLDDVENLGAFVELEVVLRPGMSAKKGKETAIDLMRMLGIEDGDLVEGLTSTF